MRKIKPKSNEVLESVPTTSNTKKQNQKTYPYVRFEHEFFPEMKKWKVEKEYTISLKLKMTGISISKFQNDSEFDILEVEAESEAGSEAGSEIEDENKDETKKV